MVVGALDALVNGVTTTLARLSLLRRLLQRLRKWWQTLRQISVLALWLLPMVVAFGKQARQSQPLLQLQQAGKGLGTLLRSIAASSSFSSNANVVVSGAASISATSSATASSSTLLNGRATIAAASSFTASGGQIRFGAAAISAQSTVTAAGEIKWQTESGATTSWSDESSASTNYTKQPSASTPWQRAA